MKTMKIIISSLVVILPAAVFAGEPAPGSVGVPTLNEWGAIATAAVLGVAGAYALLRRK